jgi:hypothetical protein
MRAPGGGGQLLFEGLLHHSPPHQALACNPHAMGSGIMYVHGFGVSTAATGGLSAP